jgi:hypothetical protein
MNTSPYKKNGFKSYSDMTTKELRSATREYDLPVKGDRLPGRALTSAQRKLWECAKARGRGRPRIGNGVKVISLSVERGLLAMADAEAKARDISRAEVFARGLREMLCKPRANGQR